MNANDWVTLAGILLGFLGTCLGIVAGMKKANQEISRQISELKAQSEKHREHDREQYLAILRLTVMSEEMPISERIIAGKKYIDEGGNGDVKKFYYERLLPEHTK